MNNSLITMQIKKIARNLFVVNLLLLIISVVVLVYNWSDFHNKILGPKEVKISEVSKLKASGFDARNYVKISPEKKAATGLAYIEHKYDKNHRETSKTVKKVYYALKDGQNVIFAAVPADKINMITYNGWVREMTSEERINLSKDITKLKTAENFKVSEYILDADDSSIAIFLYVVFGIVIIINLFNILRAIKYSKFPEEHKVYKKLMQYGNADEVINSIEEELTYDSFPNNKKLYVLKSWIVSSKGFSVDVNKIDDIVWAYKKVTKHSVNFIPTGKTFELILHFNNKSQSTIGLKKDEADYILTLFNQMYPWIVLGFTNQIKKEWKSNSQQLIDYVQAEKQRITDEKNNTMM